MLSKALSVSVLAPVAALVMSVLAPAAIADTAPGVSPDQVAARCLQRIGNVKDATAGDVRKLRLVTVQTVRFLDAQGAPAPVIAAAGNAGKQDIAARTARGANRIGAIVQNCVDALQRLDAPAPLIAAVRAGGAGAIAYLERVATRSIGAIDRAVAGAINDG